ncbi:hypothetical protein [Sphingobacterium sp.]|uniref:hypothetical protein n=1 Tax=Sphingobacterium sp. TaxID=341027 RepID=UPI002FDD7AC5
MSDNILEPTINGLPPVTDWQKVFLALQQANEAFLRGATLPELGKQIIGDVAIQGADFEDLPAATSSAPVPLPIPEAELKYGFLAKGTFTQPNAGDLVYSAKQWGLVIFNDEKWTKKFTLEIPEPTGVDKIIEGSSDVPTSDATYQFAVSKESGQALPEGWNFEGFDRPDLAIKNIPMLDKENSILGYIKISPTPGDDFNYDIIERPDLEMVILDKDDKVFWILPKNNNTSSGGNEEKVTGVYREDLKRVTLDVDSKVIDFIPFVENKFGYDSLTFLNPTNKPAFDVSNPSDSMGINYADLISKYDSLMTLANSNPQVTLVTKGTYGTTGATNKPQYYFRFKATPKPKAKILLTAGTHATEKMYIFGFYEIFKDIISQPYQHPTIQWIRDNCEVVVIPCNCPESISFPERINGGRTTPETRPFTASYSSNGTSITITFAQSDFPTENAGLTWDSYFQVQPQARYITIWSTDSGTILPRGLYAYSVIDGHTITISAPSNQIGSGTCQIQVWVDPNRNVDNGSGQYQVYAQSSPGGETDQKLDDGTLYALYDHKGTKAGSLQEIRNFIKFIKDENFDIVIDGHCPPAYNYVRAYNNRILPNYQQFMSAVKSFASLFNSAPFEENITKYYPTEEPAWRCAVNTNAVIIEWKNGLANSTSAEHTAAVRWAYTIMIGLLKYCVKNK